MSLCLNWSYTKINKQTSTDTTQSIAMKTEGKKIFTPWKRIVYNLTQSLDVFFPCICVYLRYFDAHIARPHGRSSPIYVSYLYLSLVDAQPLLHLYLYLSLYLYIFEIFWCTFGKAFWPTVRVVGSHLFTYQVKRTSSLRSGMEVFATSSSR